MEVVGVEEIGVLLEEKEVDSPMEVGEDDVDVKVDEVVVDVDGGSDIVPDDVGVSLVKAGLEIGVLVGLVKLVTGIPSVGIGSIDNIGMDIRL